MADFLADFFKIIGIVIGILLGTMLFILCVLVLDASLGISLTCIPGGFADRHRLLLGVLSSGYIIAVIFALYRLTSRCNTKSPEV